MTSILQTLELPTDFQQTAALYRLLERSDVEDVKRFIAEAQSLSNPLDRAAGLNIIYGRFADLDPAAAVDHLLNESGTASVEILFTIFSSWAKVDLDGAVAKSRELRVQRNRQIAEQAILMALAAQGSDVNELAGRMNSDASDPLSMLSAVQVLTLAQTDPQAAMQQALEIKSWEIQGRIVGKIAMMWAEQDDKAAMRYSRSITSQRARETFQNTLLHHLVRTRPETAIEYIYDDAFSEQERSDFFGRVFLSLAEEDPELAYHYATDLHEPEDRKRAIGVLIGILTKHDPAQAFELLQLITEPEIIRQHASAVLEQYAGIEPQLALQWAEQQETNRHEYLNTVIAVIARWDPEQALSLVSEMPESQSKTKALATVIRRIARKDPTLAIGFLDLLGNGAVRYQTTNEIAEIWLTRDPIEAFAWIKSLPSRQQASFLTPIAGPLASENLELAQALMPELTNEVVRMSWMSAIGREMAKSDPAAAVSWLAQFRAEPNFPNAIADVISQVARTDVQSALNLTEGLQGEKYYARVVASTLAFWARKDPQAAAAWASENGVLAESPNTAAAIAKNWAEFDIEGAMDWTTQLESPRARDEALVGMIANRYLTAPQAQRLLAAITEQPKLAYAASRYVNGLAQYDPAEARRQLKSLNLPMDIQTELEAALDGLE